MLRTVFTRQLAQVGRVRAPSMFAGNLARAQSGNLFRLYSTTNLNKDDVLRRVRDVVKTFNKSADPSKIQLETAFQKDLKLDSLDTVELLVAVEEEFDIEIPDKVADELKTIGETVDFIVSNPEAN